MIEALIESLVDSLKLIPFLFDILGNGDFGTNYK